MTKFLAVSRALGGSLVNESVADQVVNAADTLLTGSLIAAPDYPLRSHFNWRGSMTKTAAGIAPPVFIIRVGILGTIADAARVTLTSPDAQTAAIDTGYFDIHAILRVVGAVAVLEASLRLGHGLAGAGFSVVPVSVVRAASAPFDLASLNLPYVGLSCNPGAAGVWTFQQVAAEMKQT